LHLKFNEFDPVQGQAVKLHQLKIFDCAARHLNVTSAARELRMSQPAVSLQLKRLEQEFSAKFYNTSNRGMKLTQQGRAFLDSVRPLIAELDKIDARFKAPSGAQQSKGLTVGGNNTLSVTVLLEVLKNFRLRHDDIQIVMETDSSEVIEQRVANSKVDVALINSPHYFPSCSYEIYNEQETLAFVPTDSPIARTAMNLATLTKLPLVTRKESACVKELMRRGYEPNIAMEFVAPDAVKAAVQRGLGVGLLFRARIEPDIEKGDFRAIDLPELQALTHKSYTRVRSKFTWLESFLGGFRHRK
jgi:DNA-binding transcriptional LysR family regulator